MRRLGGGGFRPYLGRSVWHCAARERGAPNAETRGVTGQKSAEVIVPRSEPGGWNMPVKLATRKHDHGKDPNQHRGADLRTLSKPEPPQGAMSVENRTQAEKASSRGYTLVDVLDPENLAQAWKRVKANEGRRASTAWRWVIFPPSCRHWESIRAKLEVGTYKPAPVRRVDIHKDGGGKRALGIPTVLDRPDPAGDRAGANTLLRPNLQ